jgi:hypothetical protein
MYARMALTEQLDPEFRELIKARPEFDEVWKLMALAGTYDAATGWMPKGMRRLKQLGSPYLDPLKREWERLYGIRFKECYLEESSE